MLVLNPEIIMWEEFKDLMKVLLSSCLSLFLSYFSTPIFLLIQFFFIFLQDFIYYSL